MTKFTLKWVVGVTLFLVPTALVYLITYFFGLSGLATCLVITLYWTISNTFANSTVAGDTQDNTQLTEYPQWKTTKLGFTEEVLYNQALDALEQKKVSLQQLKLVEAFIASRLESPHDFSGYTRDQLAFYIRQAYNAPKSDSSKEFDEFVDLDA